jgi:hypothetical protein
MEIDPNALKSLRREEGLKNPDDLYDLSHRARLGAEAKNRAEKRLELLKRCEEFVKKIEAKVSADFEKMLAEEREGKVSVSPQIIEFLRDNNLHKPQFSILRDRAEAEKILAELDIGTALESENSFVIVFNLPKPIAQFWWKGGTDLWGEQAVEVEGKVIEWGYFYRKIMETVWEAIGYCESETSLRLNRLNGIGEHDPKNFTMFGKFL